MNVAGLGCPKKRDKFLCLFKNIHQVDLLIMVETHFNNEIINKLKINSNIKNLLATSFSSNKCGVALISFNPNIVFEDSDIDEEGRYIFTKLKLNNKSYNLLSIYAPAADTIIKQHFYKKMLKKYKKTKIDILTGDFNSISNSSDSSNGQVHKFAPLELLTNHFNLQDHWLLSKRGPKLTFSSRKNTGYSSRLDIMRVS